MERPREAKDRQSDENRALDIRPLLERSLGTGAALVLFCLVLITCVDVVGRYFFSAPLAGAFELTEVLLAAIVFMALPLTTERREHVEVDLLGTVLGAGAGRLLSAFAGLFSAALLATFSWRLASHAYKAARAGAVTNALEIPLAPFGYLASFACLVSAFIAFLRGIQPPIHEETDDGQEKKGFP